jgi:hypothetical protein
MSYTPLFSAIKSHQHVLTEAGSHRVVEHGRVVRSTREKVHSLRHTRGLGLNKQWPQRIEE